MHPRKKHYERITSFTFLWLDYIEEDPENSHICKTLTNRHRTYRSCIWWLNTCRYQLPAPEDAKNQYLTNTGVNHWLELQLDWRTISRRGEIDPDLEIRRHKGVVYNHHYVFIVFMDQVRADPDVDDLHHWVGGGLDPHQLHRERQVLILW